MPRRSLIVWALLSATVFPPVNAVSSHAADPPPSSSTASVADSLPLVSSSPDASAPEAVSPLAPADSSGWHWLGADELAVARDSFIVRAGQKRFLLSHSQLGDSQRVWLDGRLLSEWTEYRMDTVRGILVLESAPESSADLVVEYHFAAVAAPPRVQLHPLRRESGKEPQLAAVAEAEPAVGEGRLEGGVESTAPSREGLQVKGSKTISVQGGTHREATVDQGLHLQVNGRITENTWVRAEISDENLPITPEGNTEELQDVDQVRIQLYGPRGSALLGDFEISEPLGVFVPYQRKLQGLWLHGRDPHGTGTLLAGSPRGRRMEIEFRGKEGVQGPYELLDGLRSDQSFIVAGSERVWVDGVPQVRGVNNQYTIDYIRGTITFTEVRPIGPENRIAVDFEVSQTGYARTVLGAMVDSLRVGPLSFHTSWIREADDSSRPLGGPLSGEDEEVLRQAGDDPNRALGSGITRVGAGDEGSGLYVRRDSLGVEIYVYAPGDSMANYFVDFERVGEGQGDYRLVDVDRDGNRIFQYVGPGNGDHRIGRRLALPSSTEAAVIGFRLGSADPGQEGYLRAEADFTRRDENTLSQLDDGDNDGMAWRVAGATGWLLSAAEGMGLRLRGSAEGIGPDFHELGRIRLPFFYDAWNLQNQPRTQWEGHETFEVLARGTERSSNASIERLHRHGGYDGSRARWAAAGPLWGPLRWRHDLAFTSNENAGVSKGHRRDRLFRLGLDLGRVEPYLRWTDERYDDGPDLQKRGYQSQEWGAGLVSTHSMADGKVEFRRRLADSLSTDGTHWRFQQDLREWKAAADGITGVFRWNLDGTWRESLLSGELEERTRLGRFGLGWRPGGGLTSADLEYRAGNDRSRVIQRRIVFVGERQGDYDRDGNQVGKNLGDYNVIYTAGDSLTAAVDVRLRAKLDTQWNGAPLVGGLVFSGQFSVEERSQSDEVRKVLSLNPSVLRDPTTTIFGQQQARADVTLLRNQRRTDLRLSYDEIQGLDRRFSADAVELYRRERVLRIDRDLLRGWGLRLDGGDRERSRQGGDRISIEVNTYQVSDVFAGLELSYRPSSRSRGRLEVRATRRRDAYSGIRQKVWELTPAVTTDLLRGRWTAEFRWAGVTEEEGDPLRRPYFLERPGSNRRLSLVAQWTLGKVLSLTFRYQVRDESQRRALHDLSVETRARF